MASINPRVILESRIKEYGTTTATAAALGVSRIYLSDVLHGKRPFGKKLLTALGLEARQVVVKKSVG